MPVPGGGANGGGGGRGGSFGGGGGYGGGGGRGGGYYGGGFYRRPFGFGGGLLGGLLGIILLPIIAIFLSVILLIVNLYTTISVIAQGGQIVYDENTFQTYALEQYNKYVKAGDAHEDYLFVTFLTYEDNYEFNYLGLVGTNVKSKIIKMMGNNNTELGYAINSSMPQNYANSFDSGIVLAMDTLADYVAYALHGESPFNEESGEEHMTSKMINYSPLNMDEKSVNSALNRFTDKTGIPVVVLVDTAENVFGKTMPVANIVISVITLAVIVGCVLYIVLKIKRKRTMERDLSSGRIRVNTTSSNRWNDDF